jgi:hypothetical protein
VVGVRHGGLELWGFGVGRADSGGEWSSVQCQIRCGVAIEIVRVGVSDT